MYTQQQYVSGWWWQRDASLLLLLLLLQPVTQAGRHASPCQLRSYLVSTQCITPVVCTKCVSCCHTHRSSASVLVLLWHHCCPSSSSSCSLPSALWLHSRRTATTLSPQHTHTTLLSLPECLYNNAKQVCECCSLPLAATCANRTRFGQYATLLASANGLENNNVCKFTNFRFGTILNLRKRGALHRSPHRTRPAHRPPRHTLHRLCGNQK